MSQHTASQPMPLDRGSTREIILPAIGSAWLSRRGIVWASIWLVMGAAASYFLVPHLGELKASLRSLQRVHPGWVTVGVALMAARYVLAAISLQAAVSHKLPFGRVLLVQLSSSFVGRLTPESVGWLVLNQRYLEQSGIGRASAIAAITLKVLAGGLVRVLFTAVVALMAGTGGLFDLDLRVRWPYAFAALLTVIVLGLVLRSSLGAVLPRMLEPVRSGARDLVTVMRQPSRAGALFVASAGVTLSYPLLLLVGVKAFGADVDVLDLFAIYLGGTAVASASPTPGNLGAVEVALSAGLSAIGVAPATAIGAVMIYRLLTFWLPLIPGFFAFRFLQRRRYL